MTVDEVKKLLKIYYDIPRLIDEEWAAFYHCIEERNKVTLPSVNLTGLPVGKGLPGDRTAAMALADPGRYYDQEMMACQKQIADLQEKRNWLGGALEKLDPSDQYILELRYMGDPKNRKNRRRPPWKEIAYKVGYSESMVRKRAYSSLKIIISLHVQRI